MSPARLNIRFNIGGGGFIDTHEEPNFMPIPRVGETFRWQENATSGQTVILAEVTKVTTNLLKNANGDGSFDAKIEVYVDVDGTIVQGTTDALRPCSDEDWPI